MDQRKREALEAAGYTFGDAADFLGLTEDERRRIEEWIKGGIIVSDNLGPCPRCGSEAKTDYLHRFVPPDFFSIKCTRCETDISGDADFMEHMRAAWNRTTPAAPVSPWRPASEPPQCEAGESVRVIVGWRYKNGNTWSCEGLYSNSWIDRNGDIRSGFSYSTDGGPDRFILNTHWHPWPAPPGEEQ